MILQMTRAHWEPQVSERRRHHHHGHNEGGGRRQKEVRSRSAGEEQEQEQDQEQKQEQDEEQEQEQDQEQERAYRPSWTGDWMRTSTPHGQDQGAIKQFKGKMFSQIIA